MKNINIGNNSGIIGDGNIVVFNIQSPITKEQIEREFLKLRTGDFQDITDDVDKTLYEKRISIYSYVKNYWLQLKRQLIQEDFQEHWLPIVSADIPMREKKAYWKFTPLYQGIVFPYSYFFVEMDGGRYLIPLPKVDYNRTGDKIDERCPIRKCTITKVQYQLGKISRKSIFKEKAQG